MTASATWATGRLPFKLLTLCVAALVVLAAAATQSVVPQLHAELQHGSDAFLIRDCLDQKGPAQVWRSFDRSTFYRLCQMNDGRWGLQASTFDKVLGRLVEKTAFVKGEGGWSELLNYLARFATKYTGPLGP